MQMLDQIQIILSSRLSRPSVGLYFSPWSVVWVIYLVVAGLWSVAVSWELLVQLSVAAQRTSLLLSGALFLLVLLERCRRLSGKFSSGKRDIRYTLESPLTFLPALFSWNSLPTNTDLSSPVSYSFPPSHSQLLVLSLLVALSEIQHFSGVGITISI